MNTLNTLAGVQGLYLSPVLDISSNNIFKKSNIQWRSFENPSATYTFQTNISNDSGATWLGWETVTNNGIIPDLTIGELLTDKRLQYRIFFETTDPSIVPKIYSVTIAINGYYLVLQDDAILTYTRDIPTGFTQTYYITLPSGFTGIFADFENGAGDKFEVGYDGSKFYYKNSYRITAGLDRTLPTGEFLVGIKNNKIIIKTDTFEEIIQ